MGDLTYWVKKFRFYSTGHEEPSKNIRHRHSPASAHLHFKWTILGGVGRDNFRWTRLEIVIVFWA